MVRKAKGVVTLGSLWLASIRGVVQCTANLETVLHARSPEAIELTAKMR
jgi:hypothetical protein